MKLTVVTHYCKDDPNFDSDYSDIEILDTEGNQIAIYGDYYHDKGLEKIDGFIDGIRWATGKAIDVDEKCVADRDY